MSETLEKPETIEELEARLAAMKAEQNAAKQKQKEAYESLKSETVVNLCQSAKELNTALGNFKKDAFDGMQTVWQMLQEYSERHKDGKGNFRIESGDFRVVYRRQGKATFDEKSLQAERHIIDFVNSKFKEDQDTRDLIMSLLERKKGELDIQLVQKLYAMETRFDDQNWKRGIELLKESYHYAHSKDYLGFEERNADGEWKPINLHFSNL